MFIVPCAYEVEAGMVVSGLRVGVREQPSQGKTRMMSFKIMLSRRVFSGTSGSQRHEAKEGFAVNNRLGRGN
jgi:hypothetical protein